MYLAHITNSFDAWRAEARRCLANEIAPDRVMWTDQPRSDLLLPPCNNTPRITAAGAISVPREFVERARIVACHRDPERWPLLYRMLWRLSHGQHDLLERITDDDARRFDLFEKSVRRDRHKMTAFVRFRKVEQDGAERYIAWYRPDHHVVRLTADHFRERFGVIRWSILTPDECAHWDPDMREISFSPGVGREQAPRDDELEQLWLTYYGSIFNPARLNPEAMKKEMPVRFWKDLPEAQLIPDLMASASRRAKEMIERSRQMADEVSMTDVPETTSLRVLQSAAKACTRCPLHEHATQTVFGEGPQNADVMFVGEQPGDQEDLAGKPFVGPAGKLLDDVLAEVGIDRSSVYLTNAVKHFKFEPRGKRRIHAKPNAREMAACHVWLERELHIIQPKVLVLLGATAAQALIGSQFRITKQRGQIFESDHARWTMATYHPSALLRAPDETARRQMRADFSADLAKVAKRIIDGE